jgi:hypothetical protein
MNSKSAALLTFSWIGVVVSNIKIQRMGTENHDQGGKQPPTADLGILGGGAKSTQNKDIKKALELNRLFKDFSQ